MLDLVIGGGGDERPRDRARAFLSGWLAKNSAYHHHKETSAYTIAIAYMTAAGSTLLLEAPSLLALGRHWLLLAATAILVHALVVWQFCQRAWAARMVAASTSLLAKSVVSLKDDRLHAEDHGCRGYQLPALLNDEFRRTSPGWLSGPALSATFTLVLMLGWTGAAVCNVRKTLQGAAAAAAAPSAN